MEFFPLFFSNRQVFSRFYNFILLHILISIQRNIVHKKFWFWNEISFYFFFKVRKKITIKFTMKKNFNYNYCCYYYLIRWNRLKISMFKLKRTNEIKINDFIWFLENITRFCDRIKVDSITKWNFIQFFIIIKSR